MKIVYRLKNNEFLGFVHLEDNQIPKEDEIEISNDEFERLISVGGDIRYNPRLGKLDIVPNPDPNILKEKFDIEKWEWIDIATLDEKLEYYKQQIIFITRELAVIEAAGFRDIKLEKKLEEIKAKHMELSYELANKINLAY